jgi:hypothetical protein
MVEFDFSAARRPLTASTSWTMVTKLLANTSKQATMDRIRTMFRPMKMSGGRRWVIEWKKTMEE